MLTLKQHYSLCQLNIHDLGQLPYYNTPIVGPCENCSEHVQYKNSTCLIRIMGELQPYTKQLPNMIMWN